MDLTIAATKRDKVGTKESQKLRERGDLPGVVYGAGEETVPVTLNAKEFERVWKSAGESTLISLEGLGTEKLVLVQSVETDPLYDTPVHVDLLAVKANETVEVDVPLVFVGTAPAEKELGGTLIKVMHEMEIEALPKNLPHEIEVDISGLKTFEDQIQIQHIQLPTGVKATGNPTEVVALVQEAKEIEEEPTEAVDVTAVEIEKKGKEEEKTATE